MLAASFLVAFGSRAAAAPLAIEARFSEGKSPFTHAVGVSPAEPTSATGTVTNAAGDRRLYIANYLAMVTEAGVVDLQFQHLLSHERGEDGPILQVQGELSLLPGKPVLALDCGLWRMELGVAPLGPAAAGDDFGADHGNQRVTAFVRNGGETVACRRVLQASTGVNVLAGEARGESFTGVNMELNARPAPDGTRLEYKLTHTPSGGSRASNFAGRCRAGRSSRIRRETRAREDPRLRTA